MTTDASAAIAVTILFAVVGAYCIARTVWGFSWIDRVGNAVHALMSLVMIGMAWAWSAALPAVAQIALFTAAAFWYVYLALFRPRSDAGLDHDHHRGPIVTWYHAFMSAAMVWMAVAMTPMVPAAPAAPMAGMQMSHGAAPAAGAPMTAMTGQQAWALPVTWIAGILFVAAAAGFLVVTVRHALRAARFSGAESIGMLDSLASAAMAGGMAASFLLLMT